ncbi:MAG: abortive infection family protein [Planctomycetota bacterium]
MADLDELAPNYLRAQLRWPNAPTLAMGYESLRACHANNSHGMVEHIKSFIESVCLTIMGEYGEQMPSGTPSTTDLLVTALKPLGLQNTRGANKLDKVLSGFNKLADALSEMRDQNGPVAHGKDGFLDALTADHTRAFLCTGDAILGVLLNSLEGKQPDLNVTREPYERFKHLNKRIDRVVSVSARIDEDGGSPIVVFEVTIGLKGEVIELRIEPSKMLYGVDRSAYIEVLRSSDLSAAAAEEEMAVPEQAPLSGFGAATIAEPLMEILPVYSGLLEPLRVGLVDFLNAEGMDPAKMIEERDRLTDSLLATFEQNMGLDWKQRDTLQSRLKVACKRVLLQFGSAPKKAEDVAERLMSWLRIQAPDIENGPALDPTVTNGSSV